MLRIQGDSATAGKFAQGDPVPTPAKSQFDAVMNDTITGEPLTESGGAKEIYRALFQHPCADRVLYRFAATLFENNSGNPRLVEQVCEQ